MADVSFRHLFSAMILMSMSNEKCNKHEPEDPPETAIAAHDDTPGRMNEHQMRGTHNSYHLAPDLPFDASHKYSHMTITQQLDAGIRALELDLHMALDGELKVYHIEVIDQKTTCATFQGCLRDIAQWSRAHATHSPLIVWLETKYDTGGLPFDLSSVEQEIMMSDIHQLVVTPESMPDGWLPLNAMRGKVIFAALREDSYAADYTMGYTDMTTKMMFASWPQDRWDSPWARLSKVNSPTPAVMANATQYGVMVASNGCLAEDFGMPQCAARVQDHYAMGTHMVMSDMVGIDGVQRLDVWASP